MGRFIRWLLILPATVVAWYVAYTVGIGLLLGVSALCRPEQVNSGMCGAPWFPVATQILIAFGAGLAALLIMLVCAALAPTHKRYVAMATFAGGAIAAVIMGFGAHAFAPMVT